MKVEGDYTLGASREAVWAALHDPGVLQRTLPGCHQLTRIDDTTFEAVMQVGVASIRGTFKGRVEISQQQPPSSYRMHLSGAGAPGTVAADVDVTLEAVGDTTRLTYAADANVGGMIGGVGQRMLSGVAKKMAGEFFGAINNELVAPSVGGNTADAEMATPQEDVDQRARNLTSSTVRVESSARDDSPAPVPDSTRLVGAAIAGGVLALAGVIVGKSLNRGARR